MKKLIGLSVISAALLAFVGADVFSSVYHGARNAVRDVLTAEVPMETQLAQAQAQVDRYAESIIRGEVAAENLKDMIAGVEREVNGLAARVERERQVLTALRGGLNAVNRGELVPASLNLHEADQGEALRRVRGFEAAGELLQRRRADLDRLQREHATTLASLTKARREQIQLGEEVRVLAAEIQSLDARKAAARTRHAVGDSGISQSGYADAQSRITKIRGQLREQNKLLHYYEYERVQRSDDLPLEADLQDADPVGAIEQALARYPSSR